MAWYGIEYLVNFFEVFLFSYFIQNHIDERIYDKRLWVTLIIASSGTLFFNIVGETYILIAQYSFVFFFITFL